MATALQIQQLYIAYFGRPADPSGLDYWVSTNISTKDFAAAMYAQPEFLQANQSLPVSEQVNAIYLNLFGRNGDVAGLTYWTQQINTGKLTLASIANDLIFAANNSPASAADKAALDSKTATAITYTADVRETTASFLAYNPTSATPWVTGPQFTSAVAFLANATAANIPSAAAVQASVDAMTAITSPGQIFTLTTDQFSYFGGTGNDTFVGGLNVTGQQTLLAQDTIVGGGGTNTLIATIVDSVTPASISNIQNVNLTFQDTNASIVNLSNATGITTLTNNGSSGNASVSGLSTSTAVVSQNTSTNFVLAFAGVTGTSDSAALTLSGVNGGTTTIAGIETLTLLSSGSTTNTLALLDAAQLTTLNVGGTAGLTITGALAAVTSVNQPVGGALSGALKLVFTQGAVTVTGGAGNDTFTVNGVGNANLSGGAGNDTFVFAATAFTANDTVTGGDGTTDTLQVDAADAAVANTNITGVEILAVSGAVGATLNTGGVTSGINTVNLLSGTGVAASTITGPAGTLSLNLGTTTNFGALAGQLTVNDTGVATTDVLNLSNSNATLNAFNGQALVFGGYETVNLATGSGSIAQTTGVITLTPDGVGTGVLNISGANGITTGAITATTINASGLTGTAALVMGAGTQTATSITGTANADTLIASAAGTLIEAGAGNDSIVGGAGNDTLRGGAGKDTITAGTGNDNIDGGEDNDRILLAGNLTASDTVDGGAGTNTAVITAAVASAAIGARLSNIQILETSDAAQDMSFFANSTITSIAETGGALAVTGASANLNTFNVLAAAPDLINSSFRRATDTSSDALTVSAGGDIGAGSTLAVNDEETITVAAAGNNVDLDLTNAVDLTTLNISASGSAARDLAIVAVGATKLASATFSGINNVSTLLLNAAASGVSFTATVGDFEATITGGTGADSLTGGIFNDSLVGGNGADTISGGGGNDILLGGQGADQLNDGTGVDDLTAGTGADVVNLTSDSTADIVRQATSDSLASTGNNLNANLAAGDTLTYANGVDLINGFLAGATNGDVLIVDFVIAQSILGQASNGLTTSGYLSGNYNTTTGVFTVTPNGVGADTMIVQIGDGFNSLINNLNTSSVILRGVKSSNLVNSNFGGNNSTTIVPLYAAGTFTLSIQLNSFATERIFIAVDGTITPGTGVAPNPATGYTAATALTVENVDLSNLLGGNGVTINLDGVTQEDLATTVGTTGNDTFIFADGADFGSDAVGGNAIDGEDGTDTLQITAFTGAQANLGTAAADGADLTSIENIVLTNGTTNGAGGAAQDLTITGAGIYAITNAGGGAATLLGLGTGATTSYTSTAANVVDTITLGAAGQTVNTGAGSDIVNATVATAASSTITMGDNADTLNITDAGVTLILRTGARVAATDTLIQGVETINLTGASTLTLFKDAAIAVTTGNAATTVNANGTVGNTTITNLVGAHLLTLTGDSNVVVDTTANNVTKTGTGTLTLNAVTAAAHTITSASATTINAAALATHVLTTAGTGNFTITGVGNGATLTSTTTETTAATLVAGAAVTLASTGGALTVNAAAQTAGQNIIIATTNSAATTITGVSESNVGVAGVGTVATGALTITGTSLDGNTQVINGALGNDNVTVVGFDGAGITSISSNVGAGNDTVTISMYYTTVTVIGGAGNDTIDLSGIVVDGFSEGDSTITSGTGNDTVLAGAGIDTLIYSEGGTLNVDIITGYTVGTDLVKLTSGGTYAVTGLATQTIVGGNGNAIGATNSLNFITVAANGGAAAAVATATLTSIKAITAGTSAANALGTSTVTVAGQDANEQMVFVFYDSANLQAVVGSVNASSDGIATNVSASDAFYEIARIGMTFTDYGNFGNSSFAAFV